MLFTAALLPCLVIAKISELDVVDDPRRLFAIESFGFLIGGVHKTELSGLKVFHTMIFTSSDNDGSDGRPEWELGLGQRETQCWFRIQEEHP